MRIDRRRLYHLDWYLVINGLIIFVIGILNLMSATTTYYGGTYDFVIKQLIAFFIGCGLIFLILKFDYRLIAEYSLGFYILTLLLIVVVFIIGPTVSGARRWISIWGISFQPSEFMKPVLVIFLAKMLYERKRQNTGLSIKDIGVPIFYTSIPFGFIIAQPDLGTAVIILMICLAILWFVGLKRSAWILIIGSGTIIPLVAWRYVLKPYQKMRLLSFINPDLDPSGFGYHTKQALIAVGSGRFFGKGYMAGTQHKLQFIPEHHTDFIFTVIGEEWGFIGCIIFFLIFASFIYRCLKIAKDAGDELGSIIAFGVAFIIYFQFAVNVMMAIHLAPVVGITLPFISYGGSSILSTLISIGLLLNISTRRYMF